MWTTILLIRKVVSRLGRRISRQGPPLAPPGAFAGRRRQLTCEGTGAGGGCGPPSALARADQDFTPRAERRLATKKTVAASHCRRPVAVDTPRSFNDAATARNVVAPAAQASRMNGAMDSAKASASTGSTADVLAHTL